MPQLHVLISGAGISGPVLAYWLTRSGTKVTIVERSTELRKEGQMIDVRGLGLEVVKKMGLEDIVRSRTSKELGLAFVDTHGKVFAEFAVDSESGRSFSSDIEILRGDLASIFYDASKKDTEYVFGDHITGLVDDGEKVVVDFANGGQRSFDLVVAADGMSSKTRRVAWNQSNESCMRSLGQYTSYFTIPRTESDGGWARWYNAPGRRCFLVRPDNRGDTRIYLSIIDPRAQDFYNMDVAGQKKLNREMFADAGWEAARFLDGMDKSTDFYMQEIAQVKMESWSKGRIVTVGDAGYCPSPISGSGTTLAIVGAYVLAGEISRCSTHEAAFVAYENLLRPIVDDAQSLPPGAPAIVNPQTAWGIWIFGTILSIVSKSGLAQLIQKFLTPKGDKIKLPDYDM